MQRRNDRLVGIGLAILIVSLLAAVVVRAPRTSDQFTISIDAGPPEGGTLRHATFRSISR